MNRKWAVSLRNPSETIVAEGPFVEVKGDFVEIGATLVRAEDVRIVAPVGTGEGVIRSLVRGHLDQPAAETP